MNKDHFSSHMSVCRLNIAGSSGRLGSSIQNLAASDPEFEVVGCASRDALNELPMADVMIDVSHHELTPKVIQYCQHQKLPLLIGTTALSEATIDLIQQAASSIAICQASNFSVGAMLLDQLARVAGEWFPSEQITIKDRHHIDKKDAPSGTALMLKGSIESTGALVDSIESVREGQVIGEHCVTFDGQHERLILCHEVTDRDVFARGALLAARALAVKPPGHYQLSGLIGSKEDLS